MSLRHISKQARRVIIAISMVAIVASCFNNKIETPNSVTLTQESVPYQKNSQFVSIISDKEWSVAIFLDAELATKCTWASVSQVSGSGSKENIVLSYQENPDTHERRAYICVTFGKEVVTKVLTQGGKPAEPVPSPDPDPDPAPPSTQDSIKSDIAYNWMELPKIDSTDVHPYVFHHTEVSGKSVRNYSMLYDTENRVALWVAYPLHGIYMGSSGRTDAWNYDPKIPKSCQPTLFSGWGIGGYDRGHQLPSADRTSSDATNAETFYFTNMTVQNSQLNQRVWGALEGKVRGYTSSCDTLYVVTGPVLRLSAEDSIQYINDRSGKKVAVPVAYFKVLLKYIKSNNTYSSIGFWYENRQYSNSQPVQADAQTVEWIEQKTGYKFFENLPDDIESSVKKEFKPGSWGL